MATSSLVFVPLLHVIANLLLRHDVRFHVTYISSADNILADLLSRDGMDEFTLIKSVYVLSAVHFVVNICRSCGGMAQCGSGLFGCVSIG